MLMLLSSGARPRYRDDIVRALALPFGMEIQFRYETTYVEDEVVADVLAGQLSDAECLISFIKTSLPGGSTEMVPCRFARILSAVLVGSSCILRLRVGAFASDDPKTTLQSALGDLVPTWKRGKDEPFDLIGKFFFKASPAAMAFLPSRKVEGLHGFEQVVRRLVTFDEFLEKETGAFFHVEGVRLAGDGPRPEVVVRPAHGRYVVASGATVDVEVYCFRPDKGVRAVHVPCLLNISCTDEAVSFPLGDSAEIDSEYDVKTFKLLTKPKSEPHSAPVRLFTTKIDGKDDARMDIVLPFRFRGELRLIFLRLVLVAVGLAAPALISASAIGKLSAGSFIFIVVFGLVGATGAVFDTLKLRK